MLQKNTKQKSLALSIFLITLMALPLTAIAEAVLEEIVVTATRRGETDMQTTPVSVTSVSQEAFEKLFSSDIGEVASLVPNFSAATVTGFNAASFAIRGAGETDIIVYFDPKVSVLMDDFVVPHVQTQLLEPFDIESVEVLRGPQGTLFGKNATTGAVVVRTKRPELCVTDLEASLRVGNYGMTDLKAAANYPLGENFAMRFAGIWQKSDGFYRNGKVDGPITNAFGASLQDALAAVGSTPTGDGRDLGGKDVFSGRLKLLWAPNDQLSALLQLEMIRDSSDPVPVVNTTPAGSGLLAELFGFTGVTSGDPLNQAGIHNSSIVGLDGDQRVDADGIYLNVDYELGAHTLSANVGYREQESRLPNEYLGTSYESFFAATRDDNRETSQAEIRIASNSGSALSYVAGAYYQQNDAEFCVLQQLGLTEFFGSAAPGILDNQVPLLLCNAQDSTSTALYADVTFDVSDRFQLGAGLRYSDEEKDFIGRIGLPVGSIAPAGSIQDFIDNPLNGQDFSLGNFAIGPGLNSVNTDSESWTEPTWRVTGSYQMTEDFFLYGTVSTGFKSGGYNDQAGSAGAFPLQAYDPETVINFEVGFKADITDRFRLNMTAFQAEYDDFQRSTVVSLPGTATQETITFNAAEVTSRGLETEATIIVGDNATISANIGYLDAEYDEFLLDRDFDGIAETDLSGRPVVRAPEITAGIDFTYNQALHSGANLRWNASFNYEDENTYYYNDDLGPEFDTILEERTLLNANVTWTSPNECYHVSLFGKNITDDRYKTASQAVGTLWEFSNYGAPRTYGIEFGAKYCD